MPPLLQEFGLVPLEDNRNGRSLSTWQFFLLPTRHRKGNKFWVAIIKAGGRRTEISTTALAKTDDRRRAEDAEWQMLLDQVPRAGDPVTFARRDGHHCEVHYG